MIGLILVTHGKLADEFVAAMAHVVGQQEAIAAISIGPEDNMEKRRADIGAAVKLAENSGLALDQVPLDELRAIDARIDAGVFAALSVDASVAARTSHGGTAPEQVRLRVAEARMVLGKESHG